MCRSEGNGTHCKLYPLPPLHSNRLCTTISSHPRGNIPQVTFPSPPRLVCKGRTTRNKSCRLLEGCWDACSALLRDRLCVPLLLAGVVDSEEMHMLNRGHRNGVSSCRLGCHLGSRFACTLGEGLAALGAGLAGGSSPCDKHNLGRHNTAPRTLEIDNSTSLVRVNIINIHGSNCKKLKYSA